MINSNKHMTQEEVFKQLTAHAKEYGFVFPSSEIYDGLSAVYDYGQMGVELKNNIKKYWWDAMVRLNENIVGIDSAIFMHPKIWQASGHVGAFKRRAAASSVRASTRLSSAPPIPTCCAISRRWTRCAAA